MRFLTIGAGALCLALGLALPAGADEARPAPAQPLPARPQPLPPPALAPPPPPAPPPASRPAPPGPAVPQEDDPEAPPQIGRPSRRSLVPRSMALPGLRSDPSRDPVEELLVRSQSGVSFSAMLDEILDELVHQIGQEDPRAFSPLALRFVRVSPNLRSTLAQTIEARVVARLARLPNLAQVVCTECRAIRSRVEGDDWVVSLGAVRQADLRRTADEIGARAFLELDLTLQQVPTELVLAARIYKGDDGHILWASAITGDETTATVLRTGKVPPSRAEQLAELKRKIEARPYFGYMVFLGSMFIPSTTAGYFGLDVGLRIFERFGTERRHMFGLQGDSMINWAPMHTLYGGLLSAGYWYALTAPNLNKPEVRIGATVGGFLAGNDGNTAIVQLFGEVVLQFRLALVVSALYALPVKYNMMAEELGGFGGAARAAFQF